MRAKLSSSRWNVVSLLRYTLLIPIFLVSGCAYSPNLVPVGDSTILTYRAARVLAGTVDYPIVVTVFKKGPQDVKIRWTKEGTRIWGESPGNTTAQWRFMMTAPGEENPLCRTPWTSIKEADDTQEIPCTFEADKYIGKPIVGELNYRLGGEESQESHAPSRVVARVYYMVGHPK